MRLRTASLALITGLLALGPAAVAFAHGAEKNVPAKTLVEEAIAIIRTQPDQMDAIADKIKDALDSNDAEGVNLDLVSQAQTAFQGGDLGRTELLLEQAIGSTPGQPVVSPNSGPRTPPPPTSPPSAPAHLRAAGSSPIGGGEGVALLAVAAGLALIGLVVVRGFR